MEHPRHPRETRAALAPARIGPPLSAAVLVLVAAGPATKPASAPATGDLVSLGNDLVRFFAPPAPDWRLRATQNPSPNRVYFQSVDAKSALQVELTPPDFTLDNESVGTIAGAILKSLREKRKKDGTEVVMPPKIEKDHRFDIIIHERFKIGDATVDEMHLYRSVGPRTVMAEVSTVLTDPKAADGVFAAAKQSVASAKYIKPAPSKSKSPKR